MTTNNISLSVVGPTQVSSVAALFSSTTNTFSYRMSSMDVLNALVISHPASQFLNVGVGSTPNSLPSCAWGGGHIPWSSPFIGSGSVQSSDPNPAWGWGAFLGSQTQSSSMSSTQPHSHFMVGSGSNHFTTSTVSAGENPFPGQSIPWKGPLSFLGEPLGRTPLQGHWNPSQGMLQGVNPFPNQSTPMQGFFPMHGGSAGGNLGSYFGNHMGGGVPSFNQGQQGFIPSSGSIKNSFW
jgi:hypothetical protein